MILAAGRGERMRPLTDKTPKPLLKVAGKPLIHYTLESLVKAGFTDIVINVAHLGQQIMDDLGNGEQFGASIQYSIEGETGLETAGGIIKALPLLGEEAFLVINGDIACDFPLETLKQPLKKLVHLILVNNPAHHPKGDFSLTEAGYLNKTTTPKYTFSGIGVYHPQLFENLEQGVRKLRAVFERAISNQQITGEFFDGFWLDVGTEERLKELEQHLCDYIENITS